MAHARLRQHLAQQRALWKRLTPAQRHRRIAQAARQTRALDRRLDAAGLDDVGYWQPNLIDLPEYAIHSILLPTGKILFFGREPIVNGTRSNLGSASLYDPRTGVITHVPPPPVPENNGMAAPLFCSGMALLSDGTVLVAGGNLASDTATENWKGLQDIFLFNPYTETWSEGPKMSRGRWYPTLTKLPSGDVLILSGYDETGNFDQNHQGSVNPLLDIYRPGQSPPDTPLQPYPGGARGLNSGMNLENSAYPLSLYPGLFSLPDGNVALAGPSQSDSAILDVTKAMDRSTPPGDAWQQILGSFPSQQHYAGSILLDPELNAFGGDWRVLVIGGADGAGYGYFRSRVTVDALTAGPGYPVWSHDVADDLNTARFYPNTVILPDGGLVTVGGGAGADFTTPTSPQNYDVGEDAQHPAGDPRFKQVELRDPGEQTWRLGAAQQEFRTYHSTAVLLPDGRVWSAGDDGNEGPPDAPVPPSQRRDSAEVYWPPYLFDGDQCALRPAIQGVGAATADSAVITYGERFGIFTDHARAGMHAVLVAPASVTHSLDMNQRLVPLRTSLVKYGGLNADAPAGAAVAPPGWYMLFVVDAAGTPSTARWVQLVSAAEGAPDPDIVRGADHTPVGRRCTNTDGSELVEPDPPDPEPTPPPEPPAGPTRLGVYGSRIVPHARRAIVHVALGPAASGTLDATLSGAGKKVHLTGNITNPASIALSAGLPRKLARRAWGTLTVTYAGNAKVRAGSVRLNLGLRPASVTLTKATLTGLQLRVAGRVSGRPSGRVTVRAGGATRTARLKRGRFSLTTTLPAAADEVRVVYAGSRSGRLSGAARSAKLATG